jgi:hypothetical protein
VEAHGVDAPALALPAPRAARLRNALLTRARPTVRELGAYAAALGVLTVAVFLSHVQHGGFVLDDWSNRTSYLYGGHHGAFGFVSAFFDRLPGSRPGLRAYTVLTQQLFGAHMKLHLAFAVGVGWLLSVELYLLLRLARLAPLHAGLIAMLVLLLPASDATRLYAGATFVALVLAFFCAGLLLAIRALSAERRGALFAAGAVLLWGLSWSLHETASGAIVVALAVCCVLAFRARARPPAAVFGATLLATPLLLLLRPAQQAQSFGTDVFHAGTIARQSGTVFARSAVPFGQPSRAVVLALLAVIAAAGIAAALRWSAERRERSDLRRWLLLAGASALLVVIAYIPYLPSSPVWYEPLSAGPSNRINALAGIGYVGLVYGLGGVAVTLAVGRRLALAAVLPALLALVVGAGYLHQVRRDAGIWNRAFAAEESALAVVRQAVPGPAHGTVFYMFGHQPTLEGGVPVFGATWDLRAAVRLTYRDRTLDGVPVVPGTAIVCGPSSMYPTGNGYDASFASPYGHQVLINVATGAAERVDSPRACRTRAPDFAGG